MQAPTTTKPLTTIQAIDGTRSGPLADLLLGEMKATLPNDLSILTEWVLTTEAAKAGGFTTAAIGHCVEGELVEVVLT